MAPKRLKGYKTKPRLRMAEIEKVDEKNLNKQDLFLDAYMETASLSKASRLSGVTVCDHRVWAEQDLYGYNKRFAAAHDVACIIIEGEIARRAMDGVKKPLTFRGSLIKVGYTEDGELCEATDPRAVTIAPLQVTEYSDSLLQTYARAAMPDKYRDRSSVDMVHRHSILEMNDEELKEQEKRLGIPSDGWALPGEK